ncbi:hypothetical protein ARTHRO9V_100201 [Arthrobacter sp. 9V]|nr:hypothetical protein ARTHRO9V_100201 [Arthrobacter sp. 9V]
MLEWKCTAGKAAGSSLILDLGVLPYLSSTVPTLVVSSLSGLSQVPQKSLCSLNATPAVRATGSSDDDQYPALLATIHQARPKSPAADLNCSPEQIIASSSRSGRRRGGRILRDRNH